MNNYESFYRTFLAEMPWRAPSGNDFAAQLEMLQENLKHGADVEEVSRNIFKATSENQLTYWAGDINATEVSIIVDTEINGNFCKVTLTSKNPQVPAKSPPYASDLYLLIKQDLSNLNLTFTSDAILSDEAIRLWNGIVNRGNKVSVYDTNTQKYVLTDISNAPELEKFIGGIDHQRYVFVLSETTAAQRGIHHSFNIMEIKRKMLYPLFEEYAKNNWGTK